MRSASITSLCATVVVGIAACVSPSAQFNPEHLSEARLQRVASICQDVMGLSPTERLTSGVWRGDDNELDHRTSHYRGCITSLSDALIGKIDARAVHSANAKCRAEGDPNGSPALALCDLKAPKPLPGVQSAASVAANSAPSLAAASPSFFYASPDEIHQREKTSCAALGIDPSGDAFGACVEKLDRTFFDIDNPIV
jgi:hypothetical protein